MRGHYAAPHQYASANLWTTLSCTERRQKPKPIQEEWIHEQGLGLVKRLSMRRIMARRTKAATVLA